MHQPRTKRYNLVFVHKPKCRVDVRKLNTNRINEGDKRASRSTCSAFVLSRLMAHIQFANLADIFVQCAYMYLFL